MDRDLFSAATLWDYNIFQQDPHFFLSSRVFLASESRGTLIVFFLTCMRCWLVGCQPNSQVFPLGKAFVPQTVVWYKLVVNFFFGGKNKVWNNKDCVGLYFPLRV